jgi:Arc/MetJ family transcription regulator
MRASVSGLLADRAEAFTRAYGVAEFQMAWIPDTKLCRLLCRISKERTMATNLAIDPELLEQALALGGKRTKRATVEEALTEYIQRRLRQKAVEHFGTFDFDPDYDYKRARAKP